MMSSGDQMGCTDCWRVHRYCLYSL